MSAVETVVLGELLRARGLMANVSTAAPDVWIVPTEGVDSAKVLRLAAHLRAFDFSVEYALNAQRLTTRRSSQQLQDATRARARVALVCGNDGQVDVIDLHASASESGTATRISYDELVGSGLDNSNSSNNNSNSSNNNNSNNSNNNSNNSNIAALRKMVSASASS